MHQRVDGCFVGDVALDERGVAAGAAAIGSAAHRALDCGAGVARASAEHDPGPFAGEAVHDRLADARRAAGDDRDPACRAVLLDPPSCSTAFAGVRTNVALKNGVVRLLRIRARPYRGPRMIRLDGATVLLQWAAGGLAFLWVTTRRREVGLGYGWLLRSHLLRVRDRLDRGRRHLQPRARARSVHAMVVASVVALGFSIVRRRAGVSGQRATVERRSARVAAMTGIDRAEQELDAIGARVPPVLDLIPPLLGLVALVAAGIDAGDPVASLVGARSSSARRFSAR